MLLVVDNGSVYTPHLIKLLNHKNIKFGMYREEHVIAGKEKQKEGNKNNGTESVVVGDDDGNDKQYSDYEAYILSGRKKNNRPQNSLNSNIIKHAISTKKNLLGICYGAEILALTVGGTIRKTPSPRKGTEVVSITQENPLCNDNNNNTRLEVFESHNYEIARLPNQISSIGTSKSCRHELIQYENLNIFGTQFHPEMSDDGKKLIEKFCKL